MIGGRGEHRRRLLSAVLAAATIAGTVLGSTSGAGAASTLGSATVSESTQRLVQEFSKVTRLRIAPSSMCLTVLLDDQVIVDDQSDSALVPASLMKIVTAAAALDVLGPDATYSTEVFVRSDALDSVADGTLVGDVYLVGGGDPVLNTPRFGNRIPDPVAYTDVTELADRVRRSLAGQGIRRIQGRIVGDDSRYPDRVRDYYQEFPPHGDDPVWRYSDDAVNFVGPLSGLLINDGYVSYTWKTGILDRLEYVRTAAPTRHAASLFDDLLEARGLVITRRPQAGTSPPRSQMTSLASIESPDVGQIVARMLTRSDNTIAEMLLKEIGYRTLGSERATAAMVVEAVMQQALGPLAAGIEIADGSGLSRYNRLSCAAVAELLRQAGPHSPLVAGLAVAGRSGTLRACGPATWPPMAGSHNAVYAKTGTAHLSNSLAGLAQAPNGETVTFAMIANQRHMDQLDKCNALRRTLINAAARYTYGPVIEFPHESGFFTPPG